MVVVDPDGFVLLQHIGTPEGWHGWVTLGGGLEEGESLEDAAMRELVEEVGLRDVELGPTIWTRRHVFPWDGVTYDQRETYFFVRVPTRFEIAPTVDVAVLRAESVLDQRWWSLDDLGSVETAPSNLVTLVRSLLTDGPPSSPIDVGV